MAIWKGPLLGGLYDHHGLLTTQVITVSRFISAQLAISKAIYFWGLISPRFHPLIDDPISAVIRPADEPAPEPVSGRENVSTEAELAAELVAQVTQTSLGETRRSS